MERGRPARLKREAFIVVVAPYGTLGETPALQGQNQKEKLMNAKFSMGTLGLAALLVAGGIGWQHQRAAARTLPGQNAAPVGVKAALKAKIDALPSAFEAPLLTEPLRPGTRAPDFVLPDQDGVKHRLADLRGKTVVLAFYPQDYTAVCTLAVVNLYNFAPVFKQRGVEVFSVSVQPVESKRRFADEFNIHYPLLADTDTSVARKYGVLSQSGRAGRVNFVISPNGFIAFTNREVHAQTISKDILSELDLLGKTGVLPQVTPLSPPLALPRF